MNKDVFGSDAESFRPERWLQGPQTSAKMEQYFFTVRLPRVNTPLFHASNLSTDIYCSLDEGRVRASARTSV